MGGWLAVGLDNGWLAIGVWLGGGWVSVAFLFAIIYMGEKTLFTRRNDNEICECALKVIPKLKTIVLENTRKIKYKKLKYRARPPRSTEVAF